MAHLPEGCSFAPRFDYAMPECSEKRPALEEVGENHTRTCVYPAGDLIDVEHLVMYYPVSSGVFGRRGADVEAVDDVSFSREECCLKVPILRRSRVRSCERCGAGCT